MTTTNASGSVRAILRAAALLCTPLALAAAPPPTEPPPCTLDAIALLAPVDSATARVGDPFRFRVVDPVVAPDGSSVRGGELGYGIVASAQHAERGGRGGYVALEPRFIELADGHHVQVIANRSLGATAMSGPSRNVPGVFGAIPFAGWVLGPYAYLHHGADVTVPAGTRIPIIVGDDVVRGVCSIPSPTAIPTAPPTLAPRRQQTAPDGVSPARR